MAPPTAAQPTAAQYASGPANKSSAPTSAQANARQRVVPAIPLTYMNKLSNSTRNAAGKAPAKHTPTVSTSSNGLPASSLEAALISHDRLPSSKSSKDKGKGQHTEKPAPVVASPAGSEQPQASPLPANGVGHPDIDPETRDNYEVRAGETRGPNGDAPHYSQPHSATSSTIPDFMPSFQTPSYPLQHAQHVVDRHHQPAGFRGPPPHPMQYQHTHQVSSGGGIMFGGYESHTPSPAPHLHPFMPPPHSHMNGDNRGMPPNSHHHALSNGNGFPAPINTQFPGEMVRMPALNGYGGRTVPVPTPPGHFDAPPPSAGRYGPPTPHSFHGSHTSGEPNGVENANLPYPANGSFAHPPPHEHPAAHPPPPGAFPPFMHLQPGVRPFSATTEDDVMEGIRYTQSLFDNRELADCLLEITSIKERHRPIKVTGHSAILARSPALKQLIVSACANDQGFRTVKVELEDPYLVLEASYMVVQRLYQFPLLQLPAVMGPAANGMGFAGKPTDRYNFCLGYAAAGYHLGMKDVLIRGLECAANCVDWETVELGLGFVMEKTIQRHNSEHEEAMLSTALEFGYGEETGILHSAVMNFLISEFPANFELDTSVLDVPQIARIPTITLSDGVPTIARGTTIRQPPKQKQTQNRLSTIKFGDLPAAYPDDASLSPREPSKYAVVLSRILLNLPFDELCQVLTSNSNGVSGWNTAQDRYHAVVSVVNEREARRHRAVEAVRSGAVSNAREIQSRLSTPHRYTTAEQWDVLNWEEHVIRDETPRIVRRWVPQFDVASQPTQQRAPSPYDIPESLV